LSLSKEVIGAVVPLNAFVCNKPLVHLKSLLGAVDSWSGGGDLDILAVPVRAPPRAIRSESHSTDGSAKALA